MRTDMKVGLIAGVVVLGGLMTYAGLHSGKSSQQISTGTTGLQATETPAPVSHGFGAQAAYGSVVIPAPSTMPGTAPAHDITADTFPPTTTAPGTARPSAWDMGNTGGTGGTDPFSQSHSGTGTGMGTGGPGTGNWGTGGTGSGTGTGSAWGTPTHTGTGTGTHGTPADPFGTTPSTTVDTTGGSVYTIVSGDTLGKVAHANHVTLKALQAANLTADSSHLKIGQKITIPPASATSGTSTTGGTGTTGGTSLGGSHPLPGGGSSVGGTTGGTTAGGTTTTVPAAGTTYKVKSGDSLAKIAKQFYGDSGQYKKILRANKDQITNEDQIKEGMTLKIPH